MNPLAERRRARAEHVLASEYDDLRAGALNALRGKLAARRVRFAETDLDAFYNQAWHGLYLRLADGEQIENHAGFLVQAAFYRAIEEARRQHPDRLADAADADQLGTTQELDARLDDHTSLRQFMEGMRERLTERERQAAVLCYIQGCSRPQAAELLGLPAKRMEKLMDGVSRKVGVIVSDIRDGYWCEQHESLMKAYAFGVLDPDGERWQLASAHLGECSGCRRYVRGLRGIAAVAPPIGLPLAAIAALGGGAGHAAGAGAGAGGSGSAGSSAGGSAAGGTGSGGVGAGGIAAAAAAVVAVGSVGAFALTRESNDTPPPRPPAAVAPAQAPPSVTPRQSSKPKPKPKAKPKPKLAAATTPAATPTTAPAVTPAAAPAPAPESKPDPKPIEDAAQEFGFER